MAAVFRSLENSKFETNVHSSSHGEASLIPILGRYDFSTIYAVPNKKICQNIVRTTRPRPIKRESDHGGLSYSKQRKPH